MGKIVVPQTVSHLEGFNFREGTKKKVLHIDGMERKFSYFVPDGLRDGARVIFLAHGSHCNGDIMRTATAYEFEERARENNTIVVYPDSFGPYWNDGRLGRVHPAREAGIDEEKFYRRMVHYLSSVYGADGSQIFFGGFSNGGALGFKFTQTTLFKGIALWCINLPSVENRDYPIGKTSPVIIINNQEDRMVPFKGGDLLGSDGKSRGSFDSTYDSFLKISGENSLPEPVIHKLYREYTLGDNILIEVFKGGHVIPHPDTSWPLLLGRGSPLNSIEVVWDFFNKRCSHR